jgi:hypothetical protein
MQALDEVYEAEERRMDARFAQLCAAVYNSHPTDKKNPRKPVSPEVFMPRVRPKTAEELEAKVANFARAVNARVIKPES